MPGIMLFLVFVLAAFLVSPWFLLGCVVMLVVSAWESSGRRY